MALPFAEVLVDHLHECAAVVVGAAVVQAHHDVALLREPLGPAAGRELVVHLLRAWPAVNREDHRIALRRIERHRLHHRAVEPHRIGRGEAEQLHRRVGVRREPLCHPRVVLQLLDHLAARGPQLHLPRLAGRRPAVDVEAGIGRHVDVVCARGRRELLRMRTVETDGVQLALQRRRSRGRVIDGLRLGFAARDPCDAPVSVRHLVHDLAGVVVAIHVLPAVAVGDPEELRQPCGEAHQVVHAGVEIVHIDPRGRAVGHHEALAARCDAEEVQLHHILGPVERDDGERVGPARPIDARHVVLAGLSRVEPHARARMHVHDADLHRGIRVARLGNADRRPIGMVT